MNKEQIIEEMANDVPSFIEAYNKDPRKQHLYIEQRIEIAESLYKQGYRKERQGECEYCKTGDEKCQTCTEFYKNIDDRCIGYDDGKCIKYTPVKYCFNCGTYMRKGN